MLQEDIEAHRMFVRATHNDFLADSVERLLGSSQRICYWYASRQRLAALAPAVEELRAVVGAIKAGDSDRAAELMHAHIADFQASLLSIR